VQPGSWQAPMYQNSHRGIFMGIPDCPDDPRKETRISSIRSSQRPKPHLLPLSVFVILLYMTSSVPAGDRPCIPARFRIFPNYDLKKPGPGEMRYNRVRSMLRCTRISGRGFDRNIPLHPTITSGRSSVRSLL